MSKRVKLPTTRLGGITKKFVVGAAELYVTVNFDKDRYPRELFGKCAEHQAEVDGMALLASLALQYGCPAEVIAGKLRHRKYEPHGFPGQPCSLSDALGLMLQEVTPQEVSA